MKQQKLSILLTIILSMVGIETFAHDFEMVNGDGKTIYYTKTGETEVEVTFCNVSSSSVYEGEVVIPKTVTYNDITYNVTGIGAQAFYQCKKLTSVTIPASVTSLGEKAFYHCTGLTSVTMYCDPNNIGMYLFDGCSSLTTMTFHCKAIYSMMVGGAYALQEAIIGDEVTTIGDNVFKSFTNLKKVTMGSGVTNIGKSAFFGCSSLNDLTIGSNVTSMDKEAFRGCKSLTTIDIPASLTIIGDDVFNECTGLTTLTIPDNVTDIGERSFSGCSGLTSVTFGKGLTTIGTYAFYECSLLTTIDIPDNVTTLGYYAFQGCSSITAVNIGSGVTNFGVDVFAKCVNITSLTFHCQNVGAWFMNNSGIQEIVIGDEVESIGQRAFFQCAGLKSLTLGNQLTTIDNEAFSGCTNLTAIEIPNSVKSIGFHAFYGCTGLTTLEIPNTLTSINTSAFQMCKNITAVTIHCSEINYWFAEIPSLQEVVLGEEVTKLRDMSFYGSTGLTCITLYATTPPSCGNNVFYNVDKKNCKIIVPEESLELYKKADEWKDFGTIEANVENDPYIIKKKSIKGQLTDCITLINDAETEINALPYDDTKTLEENQKAIDDIIAKLINNLAKQFNLVGDADGDGTIDVNDVQKTINIILGKE